jgi:2-hydroxychromene-2-carboxylate isomerase
MGNLADRRSGLRATRERSREAGSAREAGAVSSAQPTFYYDLASPECYLAAERLAASPGAAPEWTPVRAADLPAGALDAFRCGEDRDVYMLEVERRARGRELQPLRWPPGWPADVELALLVATYAKQIGRAVAFSLAAFRQAFAAGVDLASEDGVVIAAAACELHPNAVLRAARTRGVREALDAATAGARAAGVAEVPALLTGEAVLAP